MSSNGCRAMSQLGSFQVCAEIQKTVLTNSAQQFSLACRILELEYSRAHRESSAKDGSSYPFKVYLEAASRACILQFQAHMLSAGLPDLAIPDSSHLPQECLQGTRPACDILIKFDRIWLLSEVVAAPTDSRLQGASHLQASHCRICAASSNVAHTGHIKPNHSWLHLNGCRLQNTAISKKSAIPGDTRLTPQPCQC